MLAPISENKIKAFADIIKDIALVFFATTVIEPIINSSGNLTQFIFGLIVSLSAWLICLFLNK